MTAPRAASPVLVGLLLAGCSSSGDGAPSGDGTAGAPAAQEPAAPAEERLEGTLRYQELPPARSVEAYLGVELVLTDAAGKEHVLAPSDRVPREALVARHGERVAVTGVWFVPPPPDPASSYPTGPGGEPLARPGRYRVTTLAALGR